ncbi:MAG: pepsin/retropepsin-like aspartic protease family protein, partial [Vicinamibacterales bacterium]|nr:pepsin/retropepsin-like aspartic protease family protein [Vicinamibacterales bacterium]
AEQTVVSREIARRQNVQPVVYTLSAGVGEVGLRGLQIGRIDSLEIGSLEIENVPCLIKNPPLTGIPTREVESFSPLAAGLSVTVDYERRRLTFGRRIADAPADVELPLRQHRLVTVRGTVNDQDASFVVDTGGEVISISSQTASTLNYRPLVRRLPLRVYGSSGWDPDAFLLPGVNLMFNSIAFPNYPVVVLNLRAPSALLGFQVGGIIGHTFLSRYRVAIDLERSVVRLQDIS